MRLPVVAISALFHSVGRALICLDAGLNVVHPSTIMEQIAGVSPTSIVAWNCVATPTIDSRALSARFLLRFSGSCGK